MRRGRPTPPAGGCELDPGLDLDASSRVVPWTPAVLPTVVAVASAPPELENTALRLVYDASLAETIAVGGGAEVTVGGQTLRSFTLAGTAAPDAVLLPVDALFETRVRAAHGLWRALRGQPPGRDSSPLPFARRRRLQRAVQALDAREARASYREVAEVLFGRERVSDAAWKTHPLRDQAIRLTRLGTGLMRGDYRHLLLHPFRRRGR